MRIATLIAARALLISGQRVEPGAPILRAKLLADEAGLAILRGAFAQAGSYYRLEVAEIPDPRPLPADTAAAQAEIERLNAELAQLRSALDAVASIDPQPLADDLPTADQQEVCALTLARLVERMTDATLAAIPGVGGKTTDRVRAWASATIAAAPALSPTPSNQAAG